MPSDRILSGSITKGSTATLSGSVKYFYQGVNARTFDSYFGSTLTRVGSGDRIELYKEGELLSKTTFDDSITINNNTADIGGENDSRVEERIGFFYEKRNFGQSLNTLAEKPFADTIRFDPVVYIQDQNEVMWPSQIWNAGSIEDYEYDGIIEPLDIRDEVYGKISTRLEGHAVRGSLTGGSSERPWGSKEITDKWFVYDNQENAFLDAPNVIEGMVHEQQAVQRLIVNSALSSDFTLGIGSGAVSSLGIFENILQITPAAASFSVNSSVTGRLKNGKYTVSFQLFFSDEYKTWATTGNEVLTVSKQVGDATTRETIATIPASQIPTLVNVLKRRKKISGAIYSYTFTTDSPTTTFVIAGDNIGTELYVRNLTITPLSTVTPTRFMQPYQSIEQSDDSYYLEQRDYHDKVYFSLLSHNNSDMRTALQLLNSSSCNRITDPFEKRANRGLNVGQQAGSITFASSYVVGEYE